MLTERLQDKLNQREKDGNLRRLTLPTAKYDFFSNDYLGLAHNEELNHIVEQAYRSLVPKKIGATGSRLLSGNSLYAMQLEEKLAHIFKGEASLLFNSGYHANSALISSVSQKGDVILYDELVHASLREGYRLSFANHIPFKHNDLEDLEKKLQNYQNASAIFVILESVYSMDGDNCALTEMLHLCKKYKAYVILDEAHSTGIFGEGGNGLVCELGLENLCFARVYTFGKAIGSHGACVVGSRVLIDYLVNFARSFIFTTAAPLHNLVSISCAFDYIKQHPDLQEDLKEKIHFYQQLTTNNQQLKIINQKPETENSLIINNFSPIQIIRISGNEPCKKTANYLIENGFEVRAILAPTVKAGEERLRICLHTFNTKEEISALVGMLEIISLDIDI
ncbi:MAG: pyridoxal phosphate-dependent aminotransferase family protein [Thermoflexibacter sp.]